MADLLADAMDYAKQDFWPLPCKKGEKDAAIKWKHLKRRPMTAQERHAGWPPRSHRNIALICGWRAGILFLNINVKNGHNGHATLQRLGWVLPPTPTIRTPSGGLALAFKVPGPDFSQFPFNTHVHPKDYDGLEFRGGDNRYQLVPPSRTPEGVYAFVHPWTLERLRADLADLPGCILQAWVRLDSRAKNFRGDEPENIGNTRKRPSAAVLTTDLSAAKETRRLHEQSPEAEKPSAPPVPLTTITTTLLPCVYTDFDGGEVETHDDACTAYVCGLVRLDASSMQGNWPFHCVLPGHGPDNDPSATWFKTTSGHFIYHDWHVRSGEDFWPVPDVFAALVTGKVKRLPKPSRKTWRLRLMVEAGLLDPYPVEMKPLPDDMPKLFLHFCERFRYLCACKWTYQERAPTMFSDEFAAGWCGIREGSIWKLRRLAVAHGFMVAARDDQGRLVYLPGKESAS
jgi:hypothetical protein